MRLLPHILVADDDRDVCEVIQHLLERHCFRVSLAGRGEGGGRVLAGDGVDLVLLDATMPGENGSSIASFAQDLGVRVIMMPGTPSCRGAVAQSGLPFIFKP